MQVSSKIRPRLSRLTFVFVGLAISVFTWGLQYKLSLYNPPLSASHQIPEAKLLSKNERIVAADAPSLTSPDATDSTPQAWLLLTTLLVCALPLRLTLGPGGFLGEQERERPWLLSHRASLSAFFFRPPPIHA